VDHLDPFAAEDLVEAGAELAVAVVDQEPRPLEQAGKAEVARLLRDPAAGRVGCAAGEVDAAASELDEEQPRQLGPLRRGAGVRPAASRSRRTVLGETCTPSLSSSPAIRG
jgi:hypothetical protein